MMAELISREESVKTEKAMAACQSIINGEGAGFLRKDELPDLFEAVQFLFGRLDVGMILTLQEKIESGSRNAAMEYTRLMNIKTFLEQLIRLPYAQEKIRRLSAQCLEKCQGLLFKRHRIGTPSSPEHGQPKDEDADGIVRAPLDDTDTVRTDE